MDANPGGRDPAYVICPKDVLTIRASEMEEISQAPYVVDSKGMVRLPVLGDVKVAGQSLAQFESALRTMLLKYVREPEVFVSVVRMHSEPIFFNGAFKSPGIYPLQGRRTLVEMVSSIGGIHPNARRRLKLTRRKEQGIIPLPAAVEDSDGRTSTAEINLNNLQQPFDPAHDIELRPYDTIAVERSEMVYVGGELNKVGSFELEDRESLSVVQLVSLAGGLTKEAAPTQARILRPLLGSSQRAEIPVNIKDIMAGKTGDFPLLANDVLYVPASKRRAVLSKVLMLTAPLASPIILLSTR
jgi:polysaccharide export outer membrane protein